jgi:hypothetical protein
MDSRGLPSEIARRQQAALDITLYWERDNRQATVVVWNWNSGVCLQLNAAPEDAAYAYAHPFAYAAAQGVPHHDIQLAA